MVLLVKEQFVIDGSGKPVRMRIRSYDRGDFEALIDIQRACFPPPFPSELWWQKEQLEQHVALFPEGALCAEIDGRLVGSMTGLIVQLDQLDKTHTWSEITDNGYIRNHHPNGNTLYIVDISVRPEYRKLGIGQRLMQTMYEVVVHLGLERLLGGGRMSGYHRVADLMSAEEYLDAVLRGDLADPVITFLLRCGRMPVGIAANYIEDEESCHYAALMEWRNPFIGRE